MSAPLIICFVLAALAVIGAVSLILQKHPIHSALSLIVVMVALAGLYLLMGAEFVAAVQIIVYGGAIMVLFIFVVMILNREEVAPLALRPLRVLGVLAGVYLFVKFIDVVSFELPSAVPAPPSDSFGTVAAVGQMLFKEFLYPFEAISVLLLVSIIGGVVISRSHQKEVSAERAAEYRKQIEEMARHDFPEAGPPSEAHGGGH